MKKRSAVRIILLLLLFYVLLLPILIISERTFGNGEGITDLNSALWYLAATLTTVGYGDVAPVTAPGRIVGVVLMLSSAGLFLYFLGLVFSVFFGRLLPRTRLRAFAGKSWYVFAACSAGDVQLAESLAGEDREGVFVFLDARGDRKNLTLGFPPRHVITDMTLEEVLLIHRGNAPVHVFFLGENGRSGYALAQDLAADPRFEQVQFCCETDRAPDHVPGHLILFDRMDAAARSYWMDHPAGGSEKLYLIAGDGRMAERLLERGLLMNVLPPEYSITYRGFGDWGHFLRNHPQLGQAVSLCTPNGESAGKRCGGDTVIFSEAPWDADPELLARADRIILCADDEALNAERMTELLRYHAFTGEVHVYGRVSGERACGFGDAAMVLTGENVMHSALNRAARRMNDFYRRKNSGGSSSWEEMSEFHRQSNIAAADHLLTKVRLLLGEDVRALSAEVCSRAYAAFCSTSSAEREKWEWLEHERWMRFHWMFNWKYSPERNNAMRLHDRLVPFEELNAEEKKLDDSAYELLGEFGEEGGL